MGYINHCGFHSGDLLFLSSTSGTVSAAASPFDVGSWCLRSNPTTTNVGYAVLRKWNIASGINESNFAVTALYMGFLFQVDTAPASGSEEILEVKTPTNTLKLAVRINSDRTLSIYDKDNALVATGTTVLSLGTPYHINVQSATGTNIAYNLRINGVTELSGQCNQLATDAAFVVFGKVVNTSGQSVDFKYGHIVFSDSEFPPPSARVRAITVDGQGNYNAWTGTYADVDETPPHDGDTSYLSSNTAAQVESVTLTSCASAGITGTIPAVLGLYYLRDAGGSSACRYGMRNGTTDLTTSASNDPGSAYVGRGYFRQTDPNGGGGWTTAGVDSLELLVVNYANVALRVTLMLAEVLSIPDPPTVTDCDVSTGAQRTTVNITVTGTGFKSNSTVKFVRANNNGVLIGGHGTAIGTGVPISHNLQGVRSIITDTNIVNVDEGISNTKAGTFLSGGVQLMVYCIRFPDTLDSALDDPPSILDTRYTDLRDALATVLEGANLQTGITSGKIMIGFFNEVSGGPGSFWKTDVATSNARQAAGLALATDLRAYLVANVTNGSSIKFCTPGMSSATIISPDYVAEPGSQEEWRQTIMREWIDWAAGNNDYVDIHLNCSGREQGEQPLRQRYEAVEDYAATIPWTLKWTANEYGNARYQNPYNTTRALYEEKAMWNYILSKTPLALMRTPFYEQSGAFIWSSIVDSSNQDKEPWASLLAEIINLPVEEPLLSVSGYANQTATSLDAVVDIDDVAIPGYYNVVVSTDYVEGYLEDGFFVSEDLTDYDRLQKSRKAGAMVGPLAQKFGDP